MKKSYKLSGSGVVLALFLALATWAFGAALVVGMVLGVLWLLWQLWTFVMSSLFDGPQGLVNPDYWVFAGAWVLASLISRVIFSGMRSKAS